MATTWTSEEENFLQVALSAIPRITEIIGAFPAQDRAGALEAAERHYTEAARDFGCAEAAARTHVSDVMRNLRTQVESIAA
jgi:DNA-directed RNA polymerase specialized sigma24 family protein